MEDDTQQKWLDIAYIKNMGISETERLIDFCLPGLKVRAIRPPTFSQGDISVPNLRRLFEECSLQWKVKPYASFEEFVDALAMFIPGTFKEDGIYFNIYYTPEARLAVVKEAARYQTLSN